MEWVGTYCQAFISCRLYHCNLLLYGISENLMRRVQSVQNAAARLLTGARRRDHISPVLCRLPLASGPEADRLQASVSCSFVTGWTSSSLPRRGYSPRCCRSRSPAPFLYGQVVQWHVQHVRRQKLCRSRDSCVEQSAIESTRRKTQFSELQVPAENSLVYCWPQRNVNDYLFRYKKHLLTYLHPPQTP